MASRRVVVTVAPRAAAGLRKAVQECRTPDMLCIHAELDPEADSCLVWKAGDPKPTAIARPGGTGERVAGNFILLIGGQEADTMKGVEDGFTFLLTSKDWTRLRDGLSSGEPVTLPAQGDMPELVLRWQK